MVARYGVGRQSLRRRGAVTRGVGRALGAECKMSDVIFKHLGVSPRARVPAWPSRGRRTLAWAALQEPPDLQIEGRKRGSADLVQGRTYLFVIRIDVLHLNGVADH